MFQLKPIGLGSEAETKTLHIPIKSSGSLGYGLSHIGEGQKGETADKRPTYAEKVTITTLDAFCEEKNIKRLDLIKADIEGWELHMLQGAQKTLSTLRPVMILESYDPPFETRRNQP